MRWNYGNEKSRLGDADRMTRFYYWLKRRLKGVLLVKIIMPVKRPIIRLDGIFAFDPTWWHSFELIPRTFVRLHTATQVFALALSSQERRYVFLVDELFQSIHLIALWSYSDRSPRLFVDKSSDDWPNKCEISWRIDNQVQSQSFRIAVWPYDRSCLQKLEGFRVYSLNWRPRTILNYD